MSQAVGRSVRYRLVAPEIHRLLQERAEADDEQVLRWIDRAQGNCQQRNAVSKAIAQASEELRYLGKLDTATVADWAESAAVILIRSNS